MWQISSVEIRNPIVIAPLAGISNPVFRTMCMEYGAGLVYSEMISDKALHYHSAKTFDMCRTAASEHPVSLQLFGGDPQTMAEAARYLDARTDCDIIDINMGCPVSKVLKAHAGSWLLDHPDLAVEIVRAVVENTGKPVTVKMRAGADAQHINCAELAQAFEAVGVKAIAVHGRTRAQMYEGQVNLDYIRMVKQAVRIPVIGNGDIKSVADVKRMLTETGCDAVMIGRGVLGRPFLISECLAALNGQPYQQPDASARLDLLLEYASRLCADRGETQAMRMMRGMAAWYLAGLPFSTAVKNQLAGVTAYRQMQEILTDYRQKLLAYSQAADRENRPGKQENQ